MSKLAMSGRSGFVIIRHMMEDTASHMPDFSAYDALEVSAISVPVRPLLVHAGPAKILAGLSSHSVLPVVDEQTRELLHVVRDTDFLEAPLPGMPFPNAAADPPVRLRADTSVQEARRLFAETPQSLIPVVDERNRYMGYCASRRQLMKLLRGTITPPRIGGLATPLGVYMTSGAYMSGAGVPGLLVTGALFALLAHAVDGLYLLVSSAAVAWIPGFAELPPIALVVIQMGFMFLTILGTIRLTPMAGLHAAEHMTINAIENGLEITASNVRTQPREHVRCGTNLMVLLFGIQIGWIAMEVMRPSLSVTGSFLYFMFWIFLVTTFWRKIGLWIQTHFTTKPPTAGQLESGMKAGRQLLEKYYRKPHPEPGFLRRLWGAGILQMLMSFAVTSWVLEQLINLWLSW